MSTLQPPDVGRKGITMNKLVGRFGAAMLAISLLGASALSGCKKEEKPAPAAAAGFNVGDTVDVEWKGSWWKGKILAKNGDKYKVHYVGWAASWDEEVEASRVRAPTADAKVGSAKE